MVVTEALATHPHIIDVAGDLITRGILRPSQNT